MFIRDDELPLGDEFGGGSFIWKGFVVLPTCTDVYARTVVFEAPLAQEHFLCVHVFQDPA